MTHPAAIILILLAAPAPPRQIGPYDFASAVACRAAAAAVLRLNRAAYPGVRFEGWRCVAARDDLP